MNINIPDKYAFWRWPGIIKQLKAELKSVREQRDKALAGQSKLLEWIKVTHRLNFPIPTRRTEVQARYFRDL